MPEQKEITIRERWVNIKVHSGHTWESAVASLLIDKGFPVDPITCEIMTSYNYSVANGIITITWME